MSTAAAAIDPASYQHVDSVGDYPTSYGQAGGYLSCPAGTRAVAAGAVSSGTRDQLTSGLTTFDGTGAFVTARGSAPGHLQFSVRCVAAAQLQGATLVTTTVREHRPPPAGYYHVGRATCPQGTVAYGGGGFVSQPGGPPVGADSLYADMPGTNFNEWDLGATAALYPDGELQISAHCLPRSQFGQIVTVTATDTAQPGTVYPTLSAAARCPAGYSAFAGGVWLHRTGTAVPEAIGYLTASVMAADDRGWFARGWTFVAGAQLTASVRCMTRVVDRSSG